MVPFQYLIINILAILTVIKSDDCSLPENLSIGDRLLYNCYESNNITGCLFKCNRGYYLNGKDWVHCERGKWTYEGDCLQSPGCPDEPNIKYVITRGSCIGLSYCEFMCNDIEHEKDMTKDFLVCGPDRVWYNGCVKKSQKCLYPPFIKYADDRALYFDCSNRFPGDICPVYCKKGGFNFKMPKCWNGAWYLNGAKCSTNSLIIINSHLLFLCLILRLFI